MKKKEFVIILLSISVPILIFLGGMLGSCSTKRVAESEYVGKKPNPAVCEHPDGIDLSHHNIAYDWTKVDAKFVYVRASFGATVADKRYDVHRKAAKRHKIPMGAYHFLVANRSVRRQFDNFSSIVKKSHLQLRPMLDVEDSKYWKAPRGFTVADARKLIREWCDLCKKRYGKAPIIYTTERIYKRYQLDKGFDDCIWWVANYNNISNYEKKCVIPYTLHQYSDKKYVEGFYGCIDCNRFREGYDVSDLEL